MKPPHKNPRLQDMLRLLANKALWGNFPRELRPLYLTQRGRCPYCTDRLVIEAYTHLSKKGDPWRALSPNRDHVWPKCLRQPAITEHRDLVLAHTGCNTRKGDRHPHPCEVLFGRFVTEVVTELDAHRRKK